MQQRKPPDHSDHNLAPFLHKLLKVWDASWEGKKKALVEQEDYTALASLTAIKKKLASWAQQEEEPTGQEFLREFAELSHYLGNAVKDWDEMESLLLTTEELTSAGSIQQDKHFLWGMPLEMSRAPEVAATA